MYESLYLGLRCLGANDHEEVGEKMLMYIWVPYMCFLFGAQLLGAGAELRAAFSYQKLRPETRGGGGCVAMPHRLACCWEIMWQCKRLPGQSAILKSYIFDCQGEAHGSVCAGDLSR